MRKATEALAATALFLIASQALAQQMQGYVGGSLGAARSNVDCVGTTGCDRSDTGGKIVGGLNITSNLAAEVIYQDYGQASAADAGVTPRIDATLHGRGFGLGLAYWAEFTPTVSGVVRLGVARNRAKASTTQGLLSRSDTETSTRPYAGLAVGYRFMPQLSVELSLDATRFRLGAEDYNARMLGVGLVYGF